MTNNKQQTAVEWYAGRQYDLEGLRDVGAISPIEYYEQLTQALQQAKEMEKEQMAVEIQKFVYKVNEKIDRELGWCGGPRNKSFEMENWRKAYANVRKWMQNLNKEFQQTYGGGEQ
jgi:predicted RecB family endonuclease